MRVISSVSNGKQITREKERRERGKKEKEGVGNVQQALMAWKIKSYFVTTK